MGQTNPQVRAMQRDITPPARNGRQTISPKLGSDRNSKSRAKLGLRINALPSLSRARNVPDPAGRRYRSGREMPAVNP